MVLFDAPSWLLGTIGGLTTLCFGVHFHFGEGAGHKKAGAGKDVDDDDGSSGSGGGGGDGGAFRAFQRNYLFVYYVIMLADWLQGTNMFTLYQSYNVDIGALFITGFASSALFSVFIGPLVDRHGRKNACVVYCVLEVIINVLEHFDHFGLLMAGRVTGGLSTALLFTSFESWMVTQHRALGFSEAQLTRTNTLATIGNGVAAVAAGFLAQVAMAWGGEIGPFQLAIALTIVGLVAVAGTWEENYGNGGDGDGDASVQAASRKGGGGEGEGEGATVSKALTLIGADRSMLLAGLTQSLFEGAMYTFVFNWVPTLQGSTPALCDGCSAAQSFSRIQGLIFAAFMLCISLGGVLFPLLVARMPVARVAVAVYAVAALAVVVPAFTTSFFPCFGAFLLLETCVGIFFITSAEMRKQIFPGNMLGTIMNVFRVPLNVVVVTGTKLNGASTVFSMCFAWFATSALLQWQLAKRLDAKAKTA